MCSRALRECYRAFKCRTEALKQPTLRMSVFWGRVTSFMFLGAFGEVAESARDLRSVRLPACVVFGSRWADFRKIRFWRLPLKSVEKARILLKSYNLSCTLRPEVSGLT